MIKLEVRAGKGTGVLLVARGEGQRGEEYSVKSR